MQQEDMVDRTVWNPCDIFYQNPRCDYGLIVLNCPIHWDHDWILRVWRQARVTVTVDGGTHRWLKYLEKREINPLNSENKQYMPNLITGDMDSCSSEMINRFRTVGCTIIETADQSYTDYTKALQQVAQYIKNASNINLGEMYVLAETSGRFDHIIGNINTLYKSDKFIGNVKIIQIASNSLTWMLKPGLHDIHVPKILVYQQSWCGLLPFGCPVNRITTTGLKWNLHNSTMQFGGLVSTSNTYNSSKVTVNTDTPLIWTMGIEPFQELPNEMPVFTSSEY